MSKSTPESDHGFRDSNSGKVDNHRDSVQGRRPNQLSARSMLVPILLGGLIAGTIDIGCACLINSADPSFILQAIASGLLGKAAFSGGPTTIAIGLVLQWAMSITIAAIFVVTSRWWPLLARRWIEAGLAYGVAIFVVMNYVVLPLSAVGHAPRFRIVHFVEDTLAMLLFGLIVAFAARQPPLEHTQIGPV